VKLNILTKLTSLTPMMDMYSRNQYLKQLRIEYLKTKSKKGKARLLDEAGKRTGLNRKYLIRKLRHLSNLDKKKAKRRKRKELYDGYVRAALVKCWEIFDYPCGQRLAPLLLTEVPRLEKLNILQYPDETLSKLRHISPATIDRKLRHEREVLHRLGTKACSKPRSLLYQKIPIRLNDWDTSVIGNVAIDFVEHCGSSKMGHYICSLSITDIASGWWEGQAIMGRGQYPTVEALKQIRSRTSFEWLEIHPDNDSAFINAHLFRYCQDEEIHFSRSRPNKKNDNCYVEQKNWTHIKKMFGYLRYDSVEELEMINDLYEQELRLYKNFLQPVMKLKEKIREGGRVHRKYGTPKTPYQRLMESDYISKEAKEKLKSIYDSLNPLELKRAIEVKLDKLYKAYEGKKKISNVEPFRKQSPRTAIKHMIQSDTVSVT